MRKLVAGIAITLDGVTDRASEWVMHSEDMERAFGAGLAESDAILLGRNTYLEYTKVWPSLGDQSPMSKFMNSAPKYILSNTLTEPLTGWDNCHLVKGELSEVVGELKSQPGKDIQIPGSPRLAYSLLRAGLLDELHLMLHPIALGSGAKLFQEDPERLNLELIDSTTLSTGVVSLSYRPAT